MAKGEVPQAVLAEQLGEAIAGRKVRAAVFTTFCFDPGFFELHVLPTLFDVPFSQMETVKRIQLEDALQAVEDIAVYYDRTALAQDALPAQLDFRRIGVRTTHGVFHPKLVLVLVEDSTDEDEEEAVAEGHPESLIVGVLSANLTRAGWWENLETGHFEEVHDKDWTYETYSFRKDLLGLLRHIRDLGGPREEQAALGRIRDFLFKRAPTDAPKNHSAKNRHHTRLFYGQTDLAQWLNDLRLGDGDWNLEVISPYFDGGHAGTLDRLIEALEPKETRVFLPQKHDGSAGVTSDLYDAVNEFAYWATLPQGLTRPGARAATKNVTPRFVHAKVYRLWHHGGKQVVLVGSVNLTAAAHSKAGAGNLEASFLVDVSDQNIPRRWWLQTLEADPSEYAKTDHDETEQAEPVYVDLAIKFDWCEGTLSYRVDGKTDGRLVIQDPAGRDLFVIDQPKANRWIDCGPEAADSVRQLLRSTSLLQVVHARGHWRVLVREEGMSHRPSLLTTLTPEEILMYWSLLSPAQREAFLGEKLAGDAQLEGLASRTYRYVAHDTLFDRFAGIYHAFERLYQHVTESIDRREFRGAQSRMFGAKYDSLPELLRKTLKLNQDPVLRYIIFLCAKQIRDRVRRHDPVFWREHRKDAHEFESLLKRLPSLAAELSIDGEDAAEFLHWYEKMFLRMIPQPEEVA